MQLQYKSDYKSIGPFEAVDLPMFTVLTGVNGSGKTHLLKALKEGHARVGSIPPAGAVFFNLADFRVESEKELTQSELLQIRKAGWGQFATAGHTGIGNVRDVLRAVRLEIFPEDGGESERLESVAMQKAKPLFDVTNDDIGPDGKDLAEKLAAFKARMSELFRQPGLRDNFHMQWVARLCSSLQVFPDNLTENEFNKHYVPMELKEGLLPVQLGRIFLDHVGRERDALIKMSLENLDAPSRDLWRRARRRCGKRYRGKAPWEVINDLLDEYGDFRYHVSDPELSSTADHVHGQEGYIPVLKDRNGQVEIPFGDLSSGEEILFSLALCLFKTESDNVFPRLLLLDEIDASLHPSMIANLLRTIENVFVKNGTRVVLASHSPTTVALAPEGSVFVVNRPGAPNRIEPRGKSAALAILTQGYATLDDGLVLASKMARKPATVVTEGHNAAYIRKAIDLFAPDCRDRIDVLGGLEGKTGASQLKTMFELVKTMPYPRHVFFVFDTDCDYRLEDGEMTHAYTFPLNESNTLTKKGIENLFDDEMFGDFTVTKTDNDTGEETVYFNARKKTKFMQRAIAAADAKNFRRLQSLVDHIRDKTGMDAKHDEVDMRSEIGFGEVRRP